MRTLCVAVGLALASANTMAADFGIGISARSDDGFLYVPINVSKSFRIEPFARYATTEVKTSQDTFEDQQESETLEIGTGLFGIKQITDAAHLYYGARLAYVDTTSDSLGVVPPFGRVARSETKQDGYRIGPTIGFEYLFGGHFSVGGEASYTFLDLEGDATTRIDDFFGTTSTAQIEQKTNSTQTRLIFRYMF